jgi:homospermidine synthase
MPPNASEFTKGPKCAIYLDQPGMNTQVKTWCPTYGPQFGFLVTHDESVSIADFFTVKQGEKVIYRPTCHYAYHPT